MGHGARGLQRRRRGLGLPARTTTPGRGPTAGARTAWPGSATSSSGCAWALALWNGRDPILKERLFGLTGPRGQPRRGRQGVLVVPRRRPQPRLELRGATTTRRRRSPTSDLRRRERPPRQARPGVRAAGHRRLRRRPLLGRRRALRQGRARTTCSCRSRSPTPGPDADTLHVLPTTVVPQHLVLGRRTARRPRHGGDRATTASRIAPPLPGELELLGRPRPGRRASPSCCSATTRPTPRGCTAPAPAPPYPKDGINDHVVGRARRR